jgi:peptidoglycan/LPS O-acetylase OafA/YrhL
MVKSFAGTVGVLFLLIGTAGFFVDHWNDWIHFDPVHNIVHLVVGAAGVWASSSERRSILFAKTVGVIYVLAAVVGFATPGMLGPVHLETSENVLHLVVGALALYAGFTTQTIETVKLKSKSG